MGSTSLGHEIRVLILKTPQIKTTVDMLAEYFIFRKSKHRPKLLKSEVTHSVGEKPTFPNSFRHHKFRTETQSSIPNLAFVNGCSCFLRGWSLELSAITSNKNFTGNLSDLF